MYNYTIRFLAKRSGRARFVKSQIWLLTQVVLRRRLILIEVTCDNWQKVHQGSNWPVPVNDHSSRIVFSCHTFSCIVRGKLRLVLKLWIDVSDFGIRIWKPANMLWVVGWTDNRAVVQELVSPRSKSCRDWDPQFLGSWKMAGRLALALLGFLLLSSSCFSNASQLNFGHVRHPGPRPSLIK